MVAGFELLSSVVDKGATVLDLLGDREAIAEAARSESTGFAI